jgi:hypothetical protein
MDMYYDLAFYMRLLYITNNIVLYNISIFIKNKIIMYYINDRLERGY